MLKVISCSLAVAIISVLSFSGVASADMERDANRTGNKIERKTKSAFEDSKDAVGGAAEDTKEGLEKAGDKTKETAENAGDKIKSKSKKAKRKTKKTVNKTLD